jgi:hypothetical protein
MQKKISVTVLKRAISQLPETPDKDKLSFEIEDLLLRQRENEPLDDPDHLKLVFNYDTELKEWILNL